MSIMYTNKLINKKSLFITIYYNVMSHAVTDFWGSEYPCPDAV